MWFQSGCKIISEVEGLKASVSIAGNMTIGSGDLQLRTKIANLLDQGVRFIELDLAGVSNFDSAGIGELVAAYTDVTNRGGRLRLHSLPRELQDILDSTNWPNFPNFPDGFAY